MGLLEKTWHQKKVLGIFFISYKNIVFIRGSNVIIIIKVRYTL